VRRKASSSITLNQACANCGPRALSAYHIIGNMKLSCLLNVLHFITNTAARLQPQHCVLQIKTSVVFCILSRQKKTAIPLRCRVKNEQNASKMLKLKSLETKNQIHLLAKVDRNGKLQKISAVADGLLHYKFNLGKWVKNFNVTRALKRLFTPVLNILLK